MKLLRTGLITAVLAVAPTYLVAQEASTTPAQAPAVAPSEAEQIQTRLGQIQQQAMQDAAIQAAFAEYNSALESADAEFRTLSERAKTLKTDVVAAQEAKDNAKLHALAAEANQLKTTLPAARARAAQSPAAQEKMTVFRTKLAQKMQEIDPEVQTLVARLGELRK